MTGPILPGASLGVLGGGQLGRMFALAARRMGYRVHVFVPEDDSPTGQVADREIRAPYDDLDALRRFASEVEVVTFEFENVPAHSLAAVADTVVARPDPSLLSTTQHRLREKRALREAGLPTVAFAAIDGPEDVLPALETVGLPAVVKTAAWGYDGKGQERVDSIDAADGLWERLGATPLVAEAFAPFEREISVVGARGVDGAVALYEPSENRHENHVLDVSIAPADLPSGVRERAREMTRALLEAWDVVGVLCVEMFLLDDGGLVVNEIAPRPHNSGHLTIDGCVCGQFEQQVRAVCGLPLGSTRPLGPAAMANLLGDLWEPGEPDWEAALRLPVALHLYGKRTPRPGRKMGHLTAVAATTEEAVGVVELARARLTAR